MNLEFVHSITCASDADASNWDRLATSLNGGVFHCYGYTIYESKLLHAKPLFVQIFDNHNKCIALAAGTLGIPRIWPFSRYCQIASFPSLPATASTDPEITQSILLAIEDHLRKIGVQEIRFASYDSPSSFYALPQLGYQTVARNEYLFDLTCDLDDLWKAMAPNRRNQIRRAEKHGVQTRLENSERSLQLLDHFHSLSMARRGILSSPSPHHKIGGQLDLIARGNAYIFVSYRNDEALNADLFGYFSGRAYGLSSGSSDNGNRYCGPVHLTWEAIKAFKELGATELCLGGARENEQGLRKFKQEFGAIEQPEPNGKKCISTVGALLSRWRRLLP